MRLDLELPEGRRTVLVGADDAGRRLTEILRRENIPLNTRCGERGLCNGCKVEIVDGASRREAKACEIVPGDHRHLTVAVPQLSLLAYEPQVQEDYRINVPIAYDPILGTTGLGFAVDVGTTTVVAQLVSLSDGEVLGKASAFNRQMHLGDDVLTRINLCTTDSTMLRRLQRAIVEETLVPLIQEALREAKRDLSDIVGYVVAGNTTMLHLFAGIDPSPMGYAPFTPRFIEHREFAAESIGLEPTGATVHLLPGAAAYVGADLTGGVLASGLVYDDGPCVLVDVGTNGEIIYRHGAELLGCATAAGPAFEGSGLTCGIRAGLGAISHVEFDVDPFQAKYELIDFDKYTKPLGICGSAYVDILAEGRRKGFLTETGRWDTDRCPALLDELVPFGEYGRALRLAYGLGKREIVVTDPDIAGLLQAKAAIAAGLTILMRRTGVRAAEVRTLYLAGGFGMHLHLQSAIDSGLLPGFSVEQIQLVGNTSLAGAYLSLLDRGALAEVARIGREMTVVELNLDPEFETTYIDQLMLP